MKYSPSQRVLPVTLGATARRYAPETVIHIIHPQADGSVELTILPAGGRAITRTLPAPEAAMIRAIIENFPPREAA